MFDLRPIRRPRRGPSADPPFPFLPPGRDPLPREETVWRPGSHDFGRVAVSAPSTQSAETVEIFHQRQSFTAAIRRASASGEERSGAPSDTMSLPPAVAGARDAQPGSETQKAELDALSGLLNAGSPLASLVSGVPEPEEGQTVVLPTITIPAALATTDAVAGKLTYAPKTTEEATDPGAGNFGLTSFYFPSVTSPTVTLDSGTYKVTATLDSPIKVQVRTPTGPDGQLDIDGDSDADITKANYATVVSDLTPNMSDLKGRPPRTKFFARDLTVKHERFHAAEYEHYGSVGATQAETWLNSQTAGSAGDVHNLLKQVPGKIISTVVANMSPPPVEERAYSDGAPSYTARANAIKAKGDKDGYP